MVSRPRAQQGCCLAAFTPVYCCAATSTALCVLQDNTPFAAIILDNSASMAQRCGVGTSLLDNAKIAVQRFHKLGLQKAAIRDRLLIVTMDLKARWIGNVQE